MTYTAFIPSQYLQRHLLDLERAHYRLKNGLGFGYGTDGSPLLNVPELEAEIERVRGLFNEGA